MLAPVPLLVGEVRGEERIPIFPSYRDAHTSDLPPLGATSLAQAFSTSRPLYGPHADRFYFHVSDSNDLAVLSVFKIQF